MNADLYPEHRRAEEPTMTPTDAKDETPFTELAARLDKAYYERPVNPEYLAEAAMQLRKAASALLAAQTENERLVRDRDELRRIRELCIKALCRATGDSRDAIEDAPLTRAIKAQERLASAEAAAAKSREDAERWRDNASMAASSADKVREDVAKARDFACEHEDEIANGRIFLTLIGMLNDAALRGGKDT